MVQSDAASELRGEPDAKGKPAGRRRIKLFATVLFASALVASAVFGWHSWRTSRPAHRFQVAMAAVQARDIAAVRREALRLTDRPGYEPHAHLLWGIVLLDSGRAVEALQDFEKAADHPDTRVLALTMAGEIFYRMNRHRDAERVLVAALEDDPSQVDARRWLAAVYYDLGAVDPAIENLLEVSRRAPDDWRPHRLLGLIHKDFERYSAAVANYKEALRRGADGAVRDEISVELAESQVELRQYADAMETLEDAPVTPDTLTLRARSLQNTGKPQEAIELLEQVLQKDPSHVDALVHHGRLTLELGKPADAVESLEKAVSQAPSDYAARYHLAHAYRAVGEPEKAATQNEVATQLRQRRERFSKLHIAAMEDPYNADLRNELGVAAEAMNRPDLAMMWYRAALAIDAEHVQARENLERLSESLTERDNTDE